MSIKIKITDDASLKLSIAEQGTVNIEVDESGTIVPAYTGTYTSDCKFVQQTFPTKDKRMTDDFKVNAIRVAETINPQGGKTVFIGL